MARRLDDSFRLAIAQLNPVVGDVPANLAAARAARADAAAAGADILLLTELFLSGYPPEDLVLRPAFLAACRGAAEALAADTADGGPAVLIGLPWEEGGVRNAMALLDEGTIRSVRFKVELPNYGVFDEKRVFRPGPLPAPINIRGLTIGLPVCEDLWTATLCRHLAAAGAELMLVPNGSPYWRGKVPERLAIAAARVAETAVPLVYANMVGGQDELVFDGGSFVMNADRSVPVQMPHFAAATAMIDWRRGLRGWEAVPVPHAPAYDGEEADWRACALGLGDYVEKNGFSGVVLGLSGGVDSAVVAALATDALGPERVRCLMLPYRFTSEVSLADAAACAKALGIRYEIMPIAGPVEASEAALAATFAGRHRDVAEENLQARIRGVLLMAVSNKLGPLLLTTGNKSEMSVGYATLYGDMNGGFNPIKDLFKTEVWRLARWRNRHRPDGLLGPGGEVIPNRIIDRPPTAELRDNQTDQDSLPPYETLDAILADLVERELSVAEVVAKGHDPVVVRRIEHLVAIAEYKRRQAAPGVKISARNFGRDRRYPITNRFRERET